VLRAVQRRNQGLTISRQPPVQCWQVDHGKISVDPFCPRIHDRKEAGSCLANINALLCRSCDPVPGVDPCNFQVERDAVKSKICPAVEHLEQRVHLCQRALAKVQHVIGYAHYIDARHLIPVMVEHRVGVSPRNATPRRNKCDFLRVILHGGKVHFFAAILTGLVFADIDSKCSAHTASCCGYTSSLKRE